MKRTGRSVTEQTDTPQDGEPKRGRSSISPRLVVLLVVIALFGGMVAAKLMATVSRPQASTSATGGSSTPVSSDSSADYAAAIRAGKPMYVLFHSRS